MPLCLLSLLLTHTLLLFPLSSASSAWQPARATFYAAVDPRDKVGGACGYGDLEKAGYGQATVALSPVLFNKGQVCGACYEVRCTPEIDNRNCFAGNSIIVTATNFCAPNLGFPANAGGRCNPPNKHFVLPIEAFRKIALWKAGNIAVQYRRIKCIREGGIRFAIDGSGPFISVLISNVAGAGDIVEVKIKGSNTGWLQMGRTWGQNWVISADLKNQPLSFELTDSEGEEVTAYNVAPKNWDFGQTFKGKQFK